MKWQQCPHNNNTAILKVMSCVNLCSNSQLFIKLESTIIINFKQLQLKGCDSKVWYSLIKKTILSLIWFQFTNFNNEGFYLYQKVNITIIMHSLHSLRLFCMGVPVSTILRNVLILLMNFDNWVDSFLSMCPSSHTTRSAPIKKIKRMYKIN